MAIPITITANNGEEYTFYYDENSNQGKRLFEENKREEYINKLQSIVDSLEYERNENPLQEVNRSIYIVSNDDQNASIVNRIGSDPNDPFKYFYPKDIDHKILKITTGALENYNSGQIAGVIEHELGHVLYPSDSRMVGDDNIFFAYIHANDFSKYLTYDQQRLADEQRKDLEETLEAVNEAFSDPSKVELIKKEIFEAKEEAIKEITNYLERKYDVYFNEEENTTEYEGDLKDIAKELAFIERLKAIHDITGITFEDVQNYKEISLKVMDYISEVEKPKFVTIDLNNQDFQSYISSIKILKTAGDKLFGFMAKNFPENFNKISPYEYAKYLIDNGKVDRNSELIALFNSYVEASDRASSEPFGNNFIPVPEIMDGVERSFSRNSPYKLPEYTYYILPEYIPVDNQYTKEEYEKLFSDLNEQYEVLNKNKKSFDNVREVDEAIADVNVNTHLAGIISTFEDISSRPKDEVKETIKEFFFGKDVHSEAVERLKYFKDKANEVSEIAYNKLQEFLDKKSVGKTEITQAELDDIVKIAGDLIEIKNNDGKEDEIIINNGTSKTTYNMTFKDTKDKVKMPTL